MSSRNIRSSSSSEGDDNRHALIIDEKKRKRMLSNRESARRSRMKKEQHIKDLNDQVTCFRLKRSEMAQKINEIVEKYTVIESENRIMRLQAEELRKRLELMEKMLLSYKNINNNSSCVSIVKDDDDEYFSLMDTLQDPLIKPWQQAPFQSKTVDGIYQF